MAAGDGEHGSRLEIDWPQPPQAELPPLEPLIVAATHMVRVAQRNGLTSRTYDPVAAAVRELERALRPHAEAEGRMLLKSGEPAPIPVPVVRFPVEWDGDAPPTHPRVPAEIRRLYLLGWGAVIGLPLAAGLIALAAEAGPTHLTALIAVSALAVLVWVRGR